MTTVERIEVYGLVVTTAVITILEELEMLELERMTLVVLEELVVLSAGVMEVTGIRALEVLEELAILD